MSLKGSVFLCAYSSLPETPRSMSETASWEIVALIKEPAESELLWQGGLKMSQELTLDLIGQPCRITYAPLTERRGLVCLRFPSWKLVLKVDTAVMEQFYDRLGIWLDGQDGRERGIIKQIG